MDEAKRLKRKIYYSFAISIFVAGALLLVLLIDINRDLRPSPIYIFINNTSEEMHIRFFGASSPSTRIDIPAGKKQVVYRPFTGDLDVTVQDIKVQPKYDLIGLEIYYLSDFPDAEDSKAETEMSFVSCMDSLYVDRRDYYSYWKGKFSGLYPNLRVYDAGAYCELNNGHQLISFSHFPADGEVAGAGQTIILFDKEDNVLKATEHFYCQTMGDLGYPVFESLEDSIVTMTCTSGDAGQFLKSTYELDLATFEFSLINKDTSLPE